MKKVARSLPPYYSHNFIVTGRSGRRRILTWGFLATLFFAVLFVLKPTLLQQLDSINYDLLLKNFPDNHANDRLVIVDLDEKSLNRYGQWPWPRYRVAELLDKIAALEPAAISLDVLFAEPDRTSAGRLLKELGDAYRLNLTVSKLPAELSDNDLILAKTLARGPFVLGNKFHFDPREKSSEQCILHPVKVSTLQESGEKGRKMGLPECTGVLCNIPPLAEKVGSSGFVNVSPDPDGMMRRLPLLIGYHGEVYASLSLATVLKLNKTDHLLLKESGLAPYSLNFQGITVPVDQHVQMLIKFRGPKGSYDYISAAEILDGSVAAARLRGRIAFVGTSASGLKELRTTPFDPILPGVEVHATVVDNLLTGDFIAVPGWANGLALLLILVLGAALSILIASRNAATSFLVMVLFAGGLGLATEQAFFRLGLFVGTAFPIAAVVAIYIFLTVLKYRLEEKRILSSLRELLLTQDVTIEGMAHLAEYRDPETGSHILRTRRYVRMLAEHLKHHDQYRTFLSDSNIDMLYKSAPLHDIGKVGIPDNILLKPGKLSSEEFEIMKAHTTIGRDVIEASIRKLGKESFLSIAAEMAHSHQEKWDGSGYPQGLKGEAIPISGRLMALADVYDALISKRVYKPPTSHAKAVEIIKAGRGSHFDPEMVDAFLEIHRQFKTVARNFADSQEERDALEEDGTTEPSSKSACDIA